MSFYIINAKTNYYDNRVLPLAEHNSFECSIKRKTPISVSLCYLTGTLGILFTLHLRKSQEDIK